MKKNLQKHIGTDGFTLVEAMVSLFVFGLIMIGVFAFFSQVSIQAKAGSLQSRYLAEARIAQQRMVSYIRDGKAVGVVSNTITIHKMNNDMASLEYIDLDNNVLTVTNNYIQYDPDTWTVGDEIIVCDHVRPCDGQTNVFTKISSSPYSVHVEFHLGDSADPKDAEDYGARGYQGVEVRFSAAPRNLQYWYQ